MATRLHRIQRNAKKRVTDAGAKFLERTGKKILRGFKDSGEYKKAMRRNRRQRKLYEERRAVEQKGKAKKITHDLIADDIFYRVLNYTQPKGGRMRYDSLRSRIKLMFIRAKKNPNRGYGLRPFVYIQFLSGRILRLINEALVDRALKDLWMSCENATTKKGYVWLKADEIETSNRLIEITIKAYMR